MEHIEIEVILVGGATRDCTIGKVYKALRTCNGMTTIDGVHVVSDGATFFDDAGDQVAVLFSNGHIKLV